MHLKSEEGRSHIMCSYHGNKKGKGVNGKFDEICKLANSIELMFISLFRQTDAGYGRCYHSGKLAEGSTVTLCTVFAMFL